eukprot:m.224519 g.224519  ORF g.224519 m.224519 type:complete len:278 (-) comp11101_c0_seq1:1388-2221(-)
MASLLEELCVGRFQALKEYFAGITVSDLIHMSREDVMGSVTDPRHRMLMAAFYGETLLPLKSSPVPRAFSVDESAFRVIRRKGSTSVELPLTNSRTALNLRRCVISSKFKSLRPSLSSLADVLSSLKELTVEEKSKITSVDLSYNDLFDDDLDELVNLCGCLIQLRDLNLARNRFHGLLEPSASAITSFLSNLLSRSTLRYVDVTGNNFASLDQISFFRTLDDKHLEKLIFIPTQLVRTSGWHSMLSSAKSIALVERTHQKYFSGTWKDGAIYFNGE